MSASDRLENIIPFQGKRENLRDGLSTVVLPLMLVLLFGLFFSIIIIPFGLAGFGAFWSAKPWETEGYLTLQNFEALIANRGMIDVLWNTFVVSVVSTIISMVGGVGMALLIARSKVPYKRLLYGMTFIPFILPGYIVAVGWIFLMGPKIGIINKWIGATFGSPIPFYNEWWIGIVIGTHYIPFMFFLVMPGIKKIDASMESASFAHGGNLIETLRSITLPLAKPAVLSALIIALIKSFEEFAIALWIGLPSKTFVVSTKIFNDIKFQTPPDYGPATALALLLMLIGVIMISAESVLVGATEQYQTVTGESYESEPAYDWGDPANTLISVGALTFMFVVNLLPVLVIIYGSFVPGFVGQLTLNLSLQNYVTALTYPGFERAFWNTIGISVVGALSLTVLAFLSSYLLFKTDLRGRRLLDYMIFLPIAAPSVVTGIGFLWTYLFLLGDTLPMYGTIGGITVALMSRYAPYATRAMHGGMANLGDALEEAALVSGARPLEILREIIAPLLRDNFVYGFIFLMLFFVKNFTVVAFLYSTGSETLSVMTWILWFSEALWGATAAVSVVIMIFVMILSYLAFKIGGVSVREAGL